MKFSLAALALMALPAAAVELTESVSTYVNKASNTQTFGLQGSLKKSEWSIMTFLMLNIILYLFSSNYERISMSSPPERLSSSKCSPPGAVTVRK